jgi:hypothetical protein
VGKPNKKIKNKFFGRQKISPRKRRRESDFGFREWDDDDDEVVIIFGLLLLT